MGKECQIDRNADRNMDHKVDLPEHVLITNKKIKINRNE